MQIAATTPRAAGDIVGRDAMRAAVTEATPASFRTPDIELVTGAALRAERSIDDTRAALAATQGVLPREFDTTSVSVVLAGAVGGARDAEDGANAVSSVHSALSNSYSIRERAFMMAAGGMGPHADPGLVASAVESVTPETLSRSEAAIVVAAALVGPYDAVDAAALVQEVDASLPFDYGTRDRVQAISAMLAGDWVSTGKLSFLRLASRLY